MISDLRPLPSIRQSLNKVIVPRPLGATDYYNKQVQNVRARIVSVAKKLRNPVHTSSGPAEQQEEFNYALNKII